jgi:hypothetical protein
MASGMGEEAPPNGHLISAVTLASFHNRFTIQNPSFNLLSKNMYCTWTKDENGRTRSKNSSIVF